jgi:hypothetical protein
MAINWKSNRMLIFFTLLIIFGIGVWLLVTPSSNNKIPPGNFVGLVPQDWDLFTNGSLIIIVQNQAGVKIELDPTETTADLIQGGLGNDNCNLDFNSIPTNGLEPGNRTMIRFINCQMVPNNKGDGYYINLSLGYIDSISKKPHKSNGFIWTSGH